MDYAVEKNSDIKRKTTLNKLHNMQWLKNTSHSANPEKIKAVIYKQEQDEDEKIKDKVLALTETLKNLNKEPDEYSTIDTCKTYLCDDTVPENDENIWDKNIDTASFPNAVKLVDQKNEEDMLSIMESIVTAKLEAEFYINKGHKDQSSILEDNAENIIQDVVCTSPSDLQKTDGDAEESKLTKHSDGNNNNDKNCKSTPCKNDKQKSICKITSIESSKASTEAKDKDEHMKTNNITKTGIKIGSNTNLTKDNEKSSSPDSKKIASDSSKSQSITDKNGTDHFNNKQNNAKNTCVKKREFVKQRNISKNRIEKEMKNTIAKPNLAKTGIERYQVNTYQSKNSNKEKALQKHQQTTLKQSVSKLKSQESLKKNTSMFNFSNDNNKIEKATHTSENVDSPLNEFERKNEKVVDEKNVRSDQKANRGVDFRKNTSFVAQYKNSTFSKSTQNVLRTGPAPYGKNPSYTYNNSKFNKDRNSDAERRVMKKGHVPINTFIKSNSRIEELDTNNLENCAKQKKEIILPSDVKSISEVDILFNDGNNINPVQMETHLIQSKENMNSSVDHPEQGSTTSEQYRVETSDISKIDTDQQYRETNNEETDPFKQSSNLSSDKCAANSQINVINQYSLKLEDMQYMNNVNQFEGSQITCNQSSDNAVQKGATIMNLQQSIQNMHFNTQQTFTQARDPTRQISQRESNNSKFYDQHFSVSDAMRLSEIPNTFTPPYECNTSISNDNGIMSNRENSNVFYRYGSNVQQRPVTASDFPGHSISPCQSNQVRWSSSVQENFHVEHPTMQPTMMHVYNPTVFGSDDLNNIHAIDYASHPVIYASTPYMQTWDSQLQYPMPVVYNSPYTNYTISHSNQSNNFDNAMYDHQHKHNPYTQINNYVRDTYNDTNTCAIQARNTADNIPINSNYYYKKYQDNRAICDVSPQYIPPISYSRSQQNINFIPATSINPRINQYNASYYPSNQKYYKQNMTHYIKNPRNQIQDLACDNNGSENTPPIISPKEFVTNSINLPNKTDQFTTRMFKPEFKTRSNSGYRSSFLSRGNFRRNTTFQNFPKECTCPISIGRGTYRAKKT